MRIFLVDIGNLIGPLLLILFVLLPRMLGAGKKKAKSQPRPRPAIPSPASRRAEPMDSRPPVTRPTAPPPQPAQEFPELSDLGEVLQELLGRSQVKPKPLPEPDSQEFDVPAEVPYEHDYYEEPAEESYKSDFKQLPEEPWETHHSLAAIELTDPARSRQSRHYRNLLVGRESLRDLMVMREILGRPRSLQPLEDWDSGGA